MIILDNLTTFMVVWAIITTMAVLRAQFCCKNS